MPRELESATRYAATSTISYVSTPAGTATSTVSPDSPAEQAASDGRLVRELKLVRVRFGRTDDAVLDGLVRLELA